MDPTEIITKLGELLQAHLKEQRKGGFVRFRNPEELQAILDLGSDDGQGNWSQVFHWIEKYLQYSVRTHHRGFLNRMWEGANLPSILGEMVELVGFVSGEGQMTTGSSNANMLAMMAARNELLDRVKADGLFGQKQLYAFVSDDAHYSLEKAANGLLLESSGEMRANDVFWYVGEKDTFDNNIHQVHAIEETLSIHLSSDDSRKGEVFN